MAGLQNGEKKVFLKNVFWADSSFFHIFDYKLLRGNPAEVLTKPNSVVLTEESAANLFGKEDPIGKQLTTHNRMDTLTFMVTGIMENVPENSHLQFNGLYSMSTLVNPADTANFRAFWGSNWVVTYLELNDNSNAKNMETRFPAFLQKYMGTDVIKGYQLFLQPLAEVHKGSSEITHDYLNFRKFDESYTNIFFVIAVIVLVIGCVNFVNLSTARAARRAKEVGVRKSIGAHRIQLVFQFLGESILLSFIGMLIAVILVFIFLPSVSRLSEHPLSFSILAKPLLFLYLIGGTLLVGIVSGICPAVYLSSFRPVKVLKGIISSGRNKSFGRNVLVVGQFASATFLIISTIFVVKQLNYMRNKNAGFNKDQVLMISGAYKNYARLKEALEGNTLVKGMTGSSQRMGSNFHQTGFNYKSDEGPVRNLASSHVYVDNNFLSLYKIKIVAGRDFTKEGNGAEYIVNESLAKELLKDKPGAPIASVVGHRFWNDSDTMSTIVGVAKDFNFNTLHNKIETLALVNYNNRGFHDVAVKIDGTRAKEAIEFIGTTYKRIIPNFPFEYQFLDEHLNQLYKADEKVSKVVSTLAGIAIIIACLGLLGLASYSAETRVKEIGIRKVMGASVSNIVRLLSRDFLKLVLIANIIAWPLAWLLLRKWLDNYAFRIDISLWVFALAGLVSLLIALIAVSSQTFKAAVANPVKNLRTE
jgi:putative ABC transport system permease protein